jgi:hypothetical protein
LIDPPVSRSPDSFNFSVLAQFFVPGDQRNPQQGPSGDNEPVGGVAVFGFGQPAGERGDFGAKGARLE